MSGISSSVGLVSGIDHTQLINQLMAIEQQPVTQLQNRVTNLTTEKSAWMTLSAGLLGIQSSLSSLKNQNTFGGCTTTSSNQDVLTATADNSASLGSYQFTVRQLVQTQQMVSSGYNSAGTKVGAGTLTFDRPGSLLSPSTDLDFLNGQQGVSRGTIAITDRSGKTANIDLTNCVTLDDVLTTINNNGIGVHAEADGDAIKITDTTGLAAGKITVSDVGQGRSAADLGIAKTATDSPLVGDNINYITRDTSLDLLNDHLGIERNPNADDLSITLHDGTALGIKLSGNVVGVGGTNTDVTAQTVGDVIDAINNASGNNGKLVASLGADGKSLQLEDTTTGGGQLVIGGGTDTYGVTSQAAVELGLAGTYSGSTVQGKTLIASLNSVLLSNLAGGSGVTGGTLHLQDRSGAIADVDISSASSVSDIIQAINSSGLGLKAGYNSSGNGISIQDTTGAATANLVVGDDTGLAAKLGIQVDNAVTSVSGGNAEHRYVSLQTKLSDMNAGQDFSLGKFTITNSKGATTSVDLSLATPGTYQTVGDVLEFLNVRLDGTSVKASINDSGTGILLTDTSGGTGMLMVTDAAGGASARELGIAGSAAKGTNFIDGSLRKTVTLTSSDTLQTAIDKINAAHVGATAGLINAGTSTSPYRLVLTSQNSGTAGQVVFDSGGSNLNLTTFVAARNALVYMGSPGSSQALALTSNTNQLTGVLPGVTLDLTGTSADPVTLTVSRDVDGIVKQLQTFASSFSSVVSNIDTYTKYDPNTKTKGALFGDASVDNVRSQLMDMIIRPLNVSGKYTRLSQVGFTLDSSNQLQFDDTKFRAAFADDPTGVTNLFTAALVTDKSTPPKTVSGGAAAIFGQTLTQLTDSYSGLIAEVTNGLDSQTKDLNNRITDLNTLLTAKRQRLEDQFNNMETALAALQGQQSSLTSLASVASSFSAAAKSSTSSSSSSSA